MSASCWWGAEIPRRGRDVDDRPAPGSWWGGVKHLADARKKDPLPSDVEVLEAVSEPVGSWWGMGGGACSSSSTPLVETPADDDSKWQCDRCGPEFVTRSGFTRHPRNGPLCTERRTGKKAHERTRTRLNGQQTLKVARVFVQRVSEGLTQHEAALAVGHRSSQCTKWMQQHGLGWRPSENTCLQPLWKRLGRTHRTPATKTKNLRGGAGRPLGEPLSSHGAVLLSADSEVKAWPSKCSTRLVLDQFEHTLATQCGFLWHGATHEQKIAKVRRHVCGPENPSSSIEGKVVSNEMQRLPRVATAAHLQQEAVKRAAREAGTTSWRDGLDGVAAVDECVIDQSGSVRRENSACTRGKFVFWTCMTGGSGGQTVFVILVPTQNKRLQWTHEQIHEGAMLHCTDCRFVNTKIHSRFMLHFCPVTERKEILLHDKASCHSSKLIELMTRSTGRAPVCPDIGGATACAAPPDGPKAHGALKKKSTSHFCNFFAKLFREAKARGEEHSQLPTMTAQNLADFLSSMINRECTPRVTRDATLSCMPITNHRVDCDTRHKNLRELVDVTHREAVENKTALEIKVKRHTCSRCGQQHCSPASIAARQHENEALGECHMLLKRMPVPSSRLGVTMVPPFKVVWWEKTDDERNGELARRSAVHQRELKTRPGHWRVKHEGEAKFHTRKWTCKLRPPITFEIISEDDNSSSAHSDDSSDAPPAPPRPAAELEAGSSSDGDSSDEPLVARGRGRLAAGRRIAISSSDDEEGSESESSAPPECTEDELDWDWPSPDKLPDGEFLTIEDARGASTWVLCAAKEDETCACVAAKGRRVPNNPNVSKETVLKLSVDVNPACARATLRSRFARSTMLVIVFSRACWSSKLTNHPWIVCTCKSPACM
eukprot:jgi/Bigna1/74500/fgenesh1_pg.29_\